MYTDNVGKTLLEIKLLTSDDEVRTCVSELESDGDAAALEKYYHKKCLIIATRTINEMGWGVGGGS